MQDTQKPTEPKAPARSTLSHGVKSLVALLVLGTGSAVAGLLIAGPNGQNGPGTAEAALAPPPLAATLLTATDIQPPAPPLQTATGKLARRETLTGLVQRLGAPANEAAGALQTLYDEDLLDPRRLLPGLEAEVFLDDGHLSALNVKAEAGRNLFIKRGTDGNWTAAALSPRQCPHRNLDL